MLPLWQHPLNRPTHHQYTTLLALHYGKPSGKINCEISFIRYVYPASYWKHAVEFLRYNPSTNPKCASLTNKYLVWWPQPVPGCSVDTIGPPPAANCHQAAPCSSLLTVHPPVINNNIATLHHSLMPARHYANQPVRPLWLLRRRPNFTSTYCGVNARLA